MIPSILLSPLPLLPTYLPDYHPTIPWLLHPLLVDTSMYPYFMIVPSCAPCDVNGIRSQSVQPDPNVCFKSKSQTPNISTWRNLRNAPSATNLPKTSLRPQQWFSTATHFLAEILMLSCQKIESGIPYESANDKINSAHLVNRKALNFLVQADNQFKFCFIPLIVSWKQIIWKDQCIVLPHQCNSRPPARLIWLGTTSPTNTISFQRKNTSKIYKFESVNGKRIAVLETPGFGNLKSLDQEDEHKANIAAAIRESILEVITVILLVNALYARFCFATHYLVDTLASTFPNILAVRTPSFTYYLISVLLPIEQRVSPL